MFVANARFDYGGRESYAGVGGQVDLGFSPDTTGSVMLYAYGDDGEVVGGWAEPVPAGDHTIGDAPVDPSNPQPVVVTHNAVAGWWDGTGWHNFVPAPGRLPYAPGDGFTAVTLDGTTETLVADLPVHQEFCGNRVQGMPNSIPFGGSFELPQRFGVAVRADWEVVPRAATPLDLSSPEHTAVVDEQLAAAGVVDVPVVLVQLLRVDLEGDGSDEVLVVAEHPEADKGNPPRAGWYGTVLLRRIVDGTAETVPLEQTTFTVDDPDQYPTFARHRVTAIADLNGDGTMEVVVDTAYFESAETTVYDSADPTGPALNNGCGV
jgi:hypothetical protein